MSVHRDKKTNTWYVKSHNHTKRGFRYKRDAKEYEAQLFLKEDNGNASLMFFTVVDEYLAYKKTEVQYTSYVKYEENVRLVLKKYFKNKPICNIDYRDCEDYRVALQKTDYSTSIKNRCITNLKEIFEYAIRHQYIESNPSLMIKTFKKTSEEVIAKQQRDKNIWTYEEFFTFLQYVEGDGYKALYFTLFNTGMRLGEALALTWNDLSNSQLTITKSCTKKTEKGVYEIKVPKSITSVRTVGIDETLNQYLLEYKELVKKQENFSENWFIFGGVRPYPESCVSQRKNSAIRRSGVKKIRIHDFRHSHATILINSGMNVVAVSKRLGHSDVNITLKVYTHLLEENNSEITTFLGKTSQKIFSKSL